MHESTRPKTFPDEYAVMGNPIAHSKSPRIHTLFAQQTQQDMNYRALLVDPGNFPAAVSEFFSQDGAGLNVTVPFKREAWTLASCRSDRAQRAGAVNTLNKNEQGEICGDNTDGVGLVRDLIINRSVTISGEQVLLLGAGGAARGVLGPLLEKHPALLVVANRTISKAMELAREFSDAGPVEGSGFPGLEGKRFSLVINATAAGLHGEPLDLPDNLVDTRGLCYDMVYGDTITPFLQWAAEHTSAERADGLGMLVEQAAESFFIWRKVRPDTGPVIDLLRGELNR